jgi:hypothetical protein
MRQKEANLGVRSHLHVINSRVCSRGCAEALASGIRCWEVELGVGAALDVFVSHMWCRGCI